MRAACRVAAAVFTGLLGMAAVAAYGQSPHAESEHHHADAQGALTAADFQHAPKDLVLWGDLARAQVTRGGGRFHVTFLPAVVALDGRTVTLVGFMAPVRPGRRHTLFLLSDRRFLCEACHSVPPPESIVEVNVSNPEPVRARPIMVRGRLELVRDDPNGLIYRLTDGKVIRRQR